MTVATTKKLPEGIKKAWSRGGGVALIRAQKGGKGAYGYSAGTGEYGDMIDAGILDPAKVTRLALQNAASVAALLLTTEVMIAEAPKEAKAGGENRRDGCPVSFGNSTHIS